MDIFQQIFAQIGLLMAVDFFNHTACQFLATVHHIDLCLRHKARGGTLCFPGDFLRCFGKGGIYGHRRHGKLLLQCVQRIRHFLRSYCLRCGGAGSDGCSEHECQHYTERNALFQKALSFVFPQYAHENSFLITTLFSRLTGQ